MLDDFRATTWEVEEMILGMAELVLECRSLRKENEDLRKIRTEYYSYIHEQAQRSEERSRAIFEGIMLNVISKPYKEEYK